MSLECERCVHAQGVANRDVKLENTLLVSSARPLIKLCDFGYSKVLIWPLSWLSFLSWRSSFLCASCQ